MIFDIVGTLLICLLCGCTIWHVTPFRPFKSFFHDTLGWHEPDKNGEAFFDGCSVHAHCRFCGKEIMQDSQGGWFEV